MTDAIRRSLSRCHGFAAVGADGPLGRVDTPVFPPRSPVPDFLIVRTNRAGRRSRRPVIPVARVAAVDEATRVVVLSGTVDELEHLPEYLPLASLVRPFTR
jgi:hypothetical protein